MQTSVLVHTAVHSGNIFNIGPAANYLYIDDPRTHWHYGTDIPLLAPPYTSFWLEYDKPDKVNLNGKIVSADNGQRLQYGAAFISIDYKEYTDKRDSIFEMIENQGMAYDPSTSTELLRMLRNTNSQLDAAAERGARWNVTGVLFLRLHGRRPIGPLIQAEYHIKEDGTLIEHPSTMAYMPVDSDPEIAEEMERLTFSFRVMMFGIRLLHCHNVSTVLLDDRRRPVDKRRDERNGIPSTIVKTLVIESPETILLGRKPRDVVNPNSRREHDVRGHFARYGPVYGRGKLFGKYEGCFWIPPMVRGNSDAGTVEKSYEVRRSRRCSS